MFSTPTKIKVFICNMIICALCLVSILAYFIMPFWKVEATYTLRAEMLQTMLPSPEDGGDSNGIENTSSLETTPEDLYSKIDLTEIVPEEGIKIPLLIEFQTSDILSSLSSDPAILVNTILQKNVDTIVSKLESTIDQLAEKAAAMVVKETFKQELKNQVKQQMGEGIADAEVEQRLNTLGLNDQYIEAQSEKLTASLFEENATVDSVTDSTIDIIKEALVTANSNETDGEKHLELTPESEAELREQLSEAFTNFADENGNINPTDAMMDMLMGMLNENAGGEDGGENDELPTPMSARNSHSHIIPLDASNDETTEEAAADLRQLITEKLMGALDGATDVIAMAIQYISYVILFSFFTWAYLIIKILAKMFMKNPAIKLGVPIWWGSLPYVFLSLVPSIAFGTLQNPPAALADIMGGMDLGMLSDLSINFFSCACVSFYIGIALALFVIFYYGRLRKRLKKIAKGEITEEAYEKPKKAPKEKPVKPAKKEKPVHTATATPAKPAEPITYEEEELFVPIQTNEIPVVEEEVTPVSTSISTEDLEAELDDEAD